MEAKRGFFRGIAGSRLPSSCGLSATILLIEKQFNSKAVRYNIVVANDQNCHGDDTTIDAEQDWRFNDV